MYLPPHFEEDRVDVMHGLIRAHPLATLVTLGADGLSANHLPLLLDAEPAPYGTLRGHVSRANRLWRDHAAGVDALAVFQGAQAYVTPSWYPAKEAHGRVVPTWNYAVVHASGPLRAIEDAAWLHEHVSRLTDRFEAGREAPWAVTDAPADYVAAQLGGIVGVEIPIRTLVGKWKVSQNRSPEDRRAVERGFRETGHPMAEEMLRREQER